MFKVQSTSCIVCKFWYPKFSINWSNNLFASLTICCLILNQARFSCHFHNKALCVCAFVPLYLIYFLRKGPKPQVNQKPVQKQQFETKAVTTKPLFRIATHDITDDR